MKQVANCEYAHQQQDQQHHQPEIVPSKSLLAKKRIKLVDGPNMSEGQELSEKLPIVEQQQQQQMGTKLLPSTTCPEKDQAFDEDVMKDSDKVKLKLKIPRPGMKRSKNARQGAVGQLYEINIKKIESLEKQLEEIKLLFNKQTSEMENLQMCYSKLREKEQIYINLSRNAMNLLDVQHK